MLVSYLQTSHPPCWSVMSRRPIHHVGQLTPDVPSTMLVSYLQTSHPPCWSVNSQHPIRHVGQLTPSVPSTMLVSYLLTSRPPCWSVKSRRPISHRCSHHPFSGAACHRSPPRPTVTRQSTFLPLLTCCCTG